MAKTKTVSKTPSYKGNAPVVKKVAAKKPETKLGKFGREVKEMTKI